ncbi:MAG: Hsp20/alpha crystallin family protein [Ardenticatenaceae bacterium]
MTKSPAHNILTLHRAMDRLFEDSMNRIHREVREPSHDNYITPRADAWENEDQIVIEMSLPGVKRENVDITFEKDTLTIHGKTESLDESKNWILQEQRRGTFHRSFSLQVPIDVEKVEATYRDGLLILHLPKTQAAKPRKIAVNAN